MVLTKFWICFRQTSTDNVVDKAPRSLRAITTILGGLGADDLEASLSRVSHSAISSIGSVVFLLSSTRSATASPSTSNRWRSLYAGCPAKSHMKISRTHDSLSDSLLEVRARRATLVACVESVGLNGSPIRAFVSDVLPTPVVPRTPTRQFAYVLADVSLAARERTSESYVQKSNCRSRSPVAANSFKYGWNIARLYQL